VTTLDSGPDHGPIGYTHRFNLADFIHLIGWAEQELVNLTDGTDHDAENGSHLGFLPLSSGLCSLISFYLDDEATTSTRREFLLCTVG